MSDDAETGSESSQEGPGGNQPLSVTPEGRQIAADFIGVFGAFVSEQVRPILRQVAAVGGEPQVLMNGLAELLRDVADSIEAVPGRRDAGESDLSWPEPAGDGPG